MQDMPKGTMYNYTQQNGYEFVEASILINQTTHYEVYKHCRYKKTTTDAAILSSNWTKHGYDQSNAAIHNTLVWLI